MKRIKYNLVLIILLLITFCQQPEVQRPEFFQNQKFVPLKPNERDPFSLNTDSVLVISNILKGYLFKTRITFQPEWGEGSECDIKSIAYMVNNQVIVKVLNDNMTNFKLFNFYLNKGQKEDYNFYIPYWYVNKTLVHDFKYYIKVEDKFYDSEQKDTIFQFRLGDFVHPHQLKISLDYVIFVGKTAGIQGYYLGQKINDTTEIYILKNRNIYSTRPYYKYMKKRSL